MSIKIHDEQGNLVNFLLDQTVRLTKLYIQRQLDFWQLNITVEQWTLLKIIEAEGMISQVDLAQCALKDTASITRMLDLLQKKNLIERSADNSDRRKFLISLTEEGQEMVKKNLQLMNSLWEKTIEGLSEGEINELKQILEKIRRNIS